MRTEDETQQEEFRMPQCSESTGSRFSRLCYLLTFFATTLVLIGWALDEPVLKSLSPHWVSMKANTAAGLLLCSVALLSLQHLQPRFGIRIAVGLALAGTAATIGALTLLEYGGLAPFSIDELLFQDNTSAVLTGAPGRMAVGSALGLLFFGLSIGIPYLGRAKLLGIISNLCGLASLVLPSTAVLGYVSTLVGLYTVGHGTSMALHTALSFIILGAGSIAQNASHPITRIVFTQGPGARFISYFLPVSVGLPILLAWFHIHGINERWFSLEHGELIETLCAITIWVSLTLLHGQTITRTDRARTRAEAEVQRSNEILEAKVSERTSTLQNTTQLLERMSQSGKIGAWELVPENNKIELSSVSRSLLKIGCASGVSVETFTACFSESSKGILNNALGMIQENGSPFELELLLTENGKSSCWVKVVGSRRVETETNTLKVKYFGTIQDIHQEKSLRLQLEELKASLEEQVRLRTNELHSSKETLLDAQKITHLGSWEWNIQSGEIHGSKEFLRIFSFKPNCTLESEDLFAQLNEAQAQVFRLKFKKACNAHTTVAFDSYLVNPDGASRYLRIRLRRHKQNEGGQEIIIGTCLDITDRVEAEASEVNTKNRFDIFMQHIPAAIYIHNSEGQIVYSNPYYDKLKEEYEALRETGTEANESKEGHNTALFGINQIDEVTEASIQFANESERIFEVRHFELTHYEQSALYGSVALDITTRKNLDRSQKVLEEKLRQQQKLEAIGTLASGVAHEINNPVNGVTNFAQLIYDKTPQESENHVFASEIIRESRRISDIVRSLLQFSRQEHLPSSPQKIGELIRETLPLINSLFKKDSISLSLDAPETLPLVCCCKQQVQQVLLNLLTNARDALVENIPKGERRNIEIICSVSDEQAGVFYNICVSDNGKGIPPALLSKIFDPFYTSKPRDKGTGLGLSISHGIAKDHGGALICENNPGTGCNFILKLPTTTPSTRSSTPHA